MEEWSVSPKDAAKMIAVVVAFILAVIVVLVLAAWSVGSLFDLLFNSH